ncbi:aldehyde dehydrogenase [Microdochium trichocladiopsis]|uniref:aldehyde dehydrogenase (NAD(+)) n=1 Tax=Microdochium trichocladiopsis TaxID=1682393 RepID=A0A9P8XWT7_9PEZI|nr:aldehyde dehydrogenase [Microdochium trichocladiopsis]KAH7018439.1 aldehyde dehydrogenase [Microdochium trichocladiopsis]
MSQLGPSLKESSGGSKSELPWTKENLPKQLFINNEYVDSKNAKKLELYNPADGSLIAKDVALAGEADVESAVAAAEAAYPAWRKTPATFRRDCLAKLADLIEQHGKQLASLTRISLGAPFGSFGSFEVNMCAEGFRYFAGWTDKFAGESYPQDDGFMKIVRNEPLGVTAGIIPWNGPLGNIGMKAGPALATGNVFILKPSEKTPFSALALGTLIKEAGFPPGVFQIISGDGSTGAIIASHMKIRKVSFTGSTTTGRKIQEAAAKSNLKRVTLELGGKSPAVVFDDCNLDNAVAWCVNAITGNTGQVCFAASRVYVQEGIYDEFVKRYKAAMEERGKAVGHPEEEGTIMGPLVDKAQFERVSGFVERGRSQGTLLTGGGRVGDSGFYIQPTVFTNVPHDAEISRDEIFGPVSVLNSFKTEDEIIAKSNDTTFGLMAGVFTQDINKAMRLATAFDSGMVGINCVSLCFLTAPFGGTKESGIGRENAINALRMFTETKTVMINLTY